MSSVRLKLYQSLIKFMNHCYNNIMKYCFRRDR